MRLSPEFLNLAATVMEGNCRLCHLSETSGDIGYYRNLIWEQLDDLAEYWNKLGFSGTEFTNMLWQACCACSRNNRSVPDLSNRFTCSIRLGGPETWT